MPDCKSSESDNNNFRVPTIEAIKKEKQSSIIKKFVDESKKISKPIEEDSIY